MFVNDWRKFFRKEYSASINLFEISKGCTLDSDMIKISLDANKK